MMSDTQLWCADVTLTLAIQIAAKESGMSEIDVFQKIAASPVYEDIYDASTGFWWAGPAYLADFIRDIGLLCGEGKQ